MQPIWPPTRLPQALVSSSVLQEPRVNLYWNAADGAPVMVSVIDTEEQIQKLLPHLDQMLTEGLIASSEVEIIKYVHQDGLRS